MAWIQMSGVSRSSVGSEVSVEDSVEGSERDGFGDIDAASLRSVASSSSSASAR